MLIIQFMICFFLSAGLLNANQLQNPGFDDGAYGAQGLSPWLMSSGQEPDWSWEIEKNGRWAIMISASDSIGQLVGVTPFTDYVITLPVSGNVNCVIFFYVGSQLIFSLLTDLDDIYRYYRASFNSGDRDTILFWFRVWQPGTAWGNIDDVIIAEADTVRPLIISAVAYDGDIQLPGIDDDDYVVIAFSEPTNKPKVSQDNIDEVFSILNGHSWLSSENKLWSTVWNEQGDTLRIDLYAVTGEPPTIEIGDQFHADMYTITDECGNPIYRGLVPITLGGTFYGGPVGPLVGGKKPSRQERDLDIFSDKATVTEYYIYETK